MLQRMKGVEPSSPAWKAGVIAVIRHPQKYEATILKNTGYVNRNFDFFIHAKGEYPDVLRLRSASGLLIFIRQAPVCIEVRRTRGILKNALLSVSKIPACLIYFSV